MRDNEIALYFVMILRFFYCARDRIFFYKCQNEVLTYHFRLHDSSGFLSFSIGILQKGMGGPLGPAIYDQAPAPMYMGGPGAPPTLSLGYPSTYGAPMIMPQQNAVAVSYDYNASMNNVASYQQIQRPVAYAPSGNMMGGGERHPQCYAFLLMIV